MAWQSFGVCPWCSARVDLQKVGRAYVCPVCACTFSRNPAKWKVGIPAAIVLATLLWFLVPLYGRLAAFLGAIAVLIGTAKSFHHQILSRGRSDLMGGEAKQHEAGGTGSRWYFVAITVVLTAIIVLLALYWVLMAKR